MDRQEASDPVPDPIQNARTGEQSGGVHISGGQNTIQGDVVGRDKIVYSTHGLSEEKINELFQPVVEAVQQAPPATQAEANAKVETLKTEVAKGKQADDRRLAKLLDGIVDLVPGAVSALVGVFAHPILGGVAGPFTKFVLDKIQGKP